MTNDTHTPAKNITITVYLADGEKHHTDRMTYEAAAAWVKKYMKAGDVYQGYNHDTNKEIKL